MRQRSRVIVDNDYSGDPDGLLQLAHQALSPSAELVAVIGSHLRDGDHWEDPSSNTAAHAAAEASQILELAGIHGIPVLAGSDRGLADRTSAIDTPAARAIIDAAMSDDPRPLYVCVGGGLTDLASAWLLEPRISSRLTAIWIGGSEYPEDGIETPANHTAVEYNTLIDPIAAQVVLNDSTLDLWQIPRNAFRQVLASRAELELHLGSAGPLGSHLLNRLEDFIQRVEDHGLPLGETYNLADSSLVLLSTLQNPFGADPSSSQWETRTAPRLDNDGTPHWETPAARSVRVFTRLDAPLLIRDFYAKLELATKQ
jgi:inosine-uridine nucleoside N-ribohydrolase